MAEAATASPIDKWEEAAAAQLEGLALQDGERQAEGAGPAIAEPAAQEGAPRALPASLPQPAPAADAHADKVDHALRDALAHPKNRASVLRLEAEVEAFVLGTEDIQHIFSGDMSSYERLLAHRTAQHWGLETSTVNHGPDQGRIVALRTPSTHVPQVKLADVPVAMLESQGAAAAAAAGGSAGMPGGGLPVGSPPAPRVLVRKRSERGPRGPGMMEGAYGMPGANGQHRSAQEREQEYNRVRARIFGEGGGPGGPGGYPAGGMGGHVPPPPPRGGPMNGGGGSGGMMGGGLPGGGMPFAGAMMGPMSPQMAASMGYAPGMARPGMPGGMYGAMPGSGYGGAGGPGGPGGYAQGGYGGGGYGGGYGGPGGGGPRPTKAQLRNKEADLADPDFRRGRGVHGQRFDPGFGEESQAAGSMYLRPTYGSEFPELSSGGSGGSDGRAGGRPAQSPRSNGGAGMMGPMGASPVQGSPAAAAAAMYGGAYAGQMGGGGMSPQDMMAMQAAYGYGQGMMPAGAMMAPMPGMMYPAGGGAGVPYGMMMAGPYGYVPVRPGSQQQEAMMQAYAAQMGMAYSPYGTPGAGGGGGIGMPMSPVAGMQNPMSPMAGSGPGGLSRRSSGPRYGGGGGGRGDGRQRSGGTPRAADSASQAHERQAQMQQQSAAAAAAAAAAAQQAQPQAQAQQQMQAQQAAQQQQQQAAEAAPPAAAPEQPAAGH